MELTPLQAHVTREIVAYVRRENLRKGHHLTESFLAERLGTSRSPVNVAFRYLAELAVLSHDQNRGYFLNKDASSLTAIARQLSKEPDDPLYLQIAGDRLSKKLEDELNEVDLMRQYDVPRSTLRKVLARMQQEGWLEKSVGHGWRFLPMIDSPEAYEESYVYRAAIEPTGLLSPSFQYDPAELQELKRQQQFIHEGGFETMTPIELFQANSQFHETLARWSGNRFIFQGVRRTDQQRRVVEYGQAGRARQPRRVQAQEHLAILEAIEQNDQLRAAALMRSHLEGARKGKVHGNPIFTAAA